MPTSHRFRQSLVLFALLAGLSVAVAADKPVSDKPLGDFEAAADVGKVDLPGSAKFDPATRQYTVTGSGENMWKTTDAFQFVHRKVSGDWTLTADVRWVGESKAPHRKAGLIFRQSLDADAPYVDLVSHGEGLIALQYRTEKGGITAGTQSTVKAPATLRLERRGDTFTASLAPSGEAFQPAGSIQVALKDPLYAGLVVCSHDAKASETAVFTNVVIQPAPQPGAK